MTISEKEERERIATRTVGGTSANVASKSQMRPLRTKNHVSKYGSITASKNYHHRTWFQRMRPTPNAPPSPIRRRSKPMSMMRSNTTSVTSELIILGLLVSALSRTHAPFSSDHVERSYVSIKPSRSKIVDIEKFTRTLPMISRAL
jgi:hypothetical protein